MVWSIECFLIKADNLPKENTNWLQCVILFILLNEIKKKHALEINSGIKVSECSKKKLDRIKGMGSY